LGTPGFGITLPPLVPAGRITLKAGVVVFLSHVVVVCLVERLGLVGRELERRVVVLLEREIQLRLALQRELVERRMDEVLTVLRQLVELLRGQERVV